MYCSRCGARNDDDARFCEKCGTDMSGMPRPTVSGTVPAAPMAPPTPFMPGTPPTPVGPVGPTVYPPARPRAWWYPIGVWVILSAFFAFLDLAATRTISWSIWPIGILGVFMVGFPLLHLAEERSSRPR